MRLQDGARAIVLEAFGSSLSLLQLGQASLFFKFHPRSLSMFRTKVLAHENESSGITHPPTTVLGTAWHACVRMCERKGSCSHPRDDIGYETQRSRRGERGRNRERRSGRRASRKRRRRSYTEILQGERRVLDMYTVPIRKKPCVRVAPGSADSQGSWVDRSPRWENPVAAPLKPGSSQ
ncbi:hypothetical protein B0H11DRAFT_2321651 [Mycena galericulata]|nr:hypothetical protein B0H11DRAFT_2321651 [Mycena galericulata]